MPDENTPNYCSDALHRLTDIFSNYLFAQQTQQENQQQNNGILYSLHLFDSWHMLFHPCILWFDFNLHQKTQSVNI